MLISRSPEHIVVGINFENIKIYYQVLSELFKKKVRFTFV